MNARFIDWIWHVRGSLALEPGQSRDDAFDRLDPLFHKKGTSHERSGDVLTFRKKNQASQDRMAVFDGGTLQIEQDAAGPVLRYHLISRALLACFLAPLLFLGIAQLTKLVVRLEKPTAAASGKAAEKAKKPEVVVPMNPIDKFLGAPAPEKKKETKDKKEGAGDGDGEGGGKKLSATPAYVFAGIFALLYIIGRILEDRLVKALFKRSLLGS